MSENIGIIPYKGRGAIAENVTLSRIGSLSTNLNRITREPLFLFAQEAMQICLSNSKAQWITSEVIGVDGGEYIVD